MYVLHFGTLTRPVQVTKPNCSKLLYKFTKLYGTSHLVMLDALMPDAVKQKNVLDHAVFLQFDAGTVCISSTVVHTSAAHVVLSKIALPVPGDASWHEKEASMLPHSATSFLPNLVSLLSPAAQRACSMKIALTAKPTTPRTKIAVRSAFVRGAVVAESPRGGIAKTPRSTMVAWPLGTFSCTDDAVRVRRIFRPAFPEELRKYGIHESHVKVS